MTKQDGLDPIRKFWTDHNFCFCNEPDKALIELGEHLRSIASGEPWNEEVRGVLWEYVLDSFGLTEHGTSVRCSWLTDPGRTLLAAIDRYVALDENERESFWETPFEGEARAAVKHRVPPLEVLPADPGGICDCGWTKNWEYHMWRTAWDPKIDQWRCLDCGKHKFDEKGRA
ncbi:MAG: hypothetical protein ABIH23_14455 [bacterium]